MFFDLYASGRLDGRRARLTDVNPDLIGCYRTVRDQTDAVIAALAALDEEHRATSGACYYDVRDRRFNPARDALGTVGRVPPRDGAGGPAAYTPALAAMFIYLNRTGYNGLFRLNRRGAFNVPAGRYPDPRICDADHIRAVARALSADAVVLDCVPFEDALAGARAGDFVYCDPPYAPLSRTSSFAHYTAGGFRTLDHVNLQRAVVEASGRGAIVLLSNSSAPEIEAAYAAPAARIVGLKIQRVPARRAINSRAALRGPVDELIITKSPLMKPSVQIRPRMLSARPRRRKQTA